MVSINGQYYIFDLTEPFWKVLFPFAFWLFPHTGFKITDEKMLEQIQDPDGTQKKTAHFNIIAIGTSLLLARILEGIADFFYIGTSFIVNVFIMFIALSIFFLFYFYISKIHKQNLDNIVNVNQLSKDKLLVRPASIKHCFLFILYYFIFLSGTVLSCWLFIDSGDVLILMLSLLLVFFLSFSSAVAAMPGETYGKLTNTE